MQQNAVKLAGLRGDCVDDLAAEVLERHAPKDAERSALVVDDQPEIVGLTEKILTGDGFEVVTATSGTEALEKSIDSMADRPLSQLDPVERGILLLGFYELQSKPDVPYKVVINESVNLAKRFGAVDGHKYINALLDRAVRKFRPEA